MSLLSKYENFTYLMDAIPRERRDDRIWHSGAFIWKSLSFSFLEKQWQRRSQRECNAWTALVRLRSRATRACAKKGIHTPRAADRGVVYDSPSWVRRIPDS
ncbi:hypothetical protein ACLOJK_021277 [Asimina triloba]